MQRSYDERLAGRGMAIGTKVINIHRVPTPHQYWQHPFWVGVIEAVGTDRESWNGHNSESAYCEMTHTVKVRYLGGCGHNAGFTQYDSIADLREFIGSDEVTESPTFTDARAIYEFACRCGLGDRYAQEVK